MVGLARTATIPSAHPSDLAGDEARAVSDGYYRYIDEGPKPSVAVVQDIDEQHGYGSLWGEVNSAIHSGLGCVGIVTNGGIRDLPEIAPASRCSPAGSSPRTLSSTWSTSGARSTSPGCGCAAATWSTLTSTARCDPHAVADKVRSAADEIIRHEKVIIAVAREPGFSVEKLFAARQPHARTTVVARAKSL